MKRSLFFLNRFFQSGNEKLNVVLKGKCVTGLDDGKNLNKENAHFNTARSDVLDRPKLIGLGPVNPDDFFSQNKPKPAIIPANGTARTLVIAQRPPRKVVVIDYPDPNPQIFEDDDYENEDDIYDEETDRVNFEEVLVSLPNSLTSPRTYSCFEFQVQSHQTTCIGRQGVHTTSIVDK